MPFSVSPRLRGVGAVAALTALAALGAPRARAAVVYLAGEADGEWRWLDVADQAYDGTYIDGYSYDQATVEVTYSTPATDLQGHLSASGLKPNFAYQLKLLACPDTPTNELVGFTGRWWQQEWLGSDWSVGWNLNSKGDGSSPNPNDLAYESRRDIAEPTSPTGLLYKYTAYRPFGYFITDEYGCAELDYVVDNCYHVLWQTSQRSPAADDGPTVSHAFDVDPSGHPQYGTDYGPASVGVFGEWERLPRDGVPLLAGAYECRIALTEESFHSSGGLGGYWALAMSADVEFTIVGAQDANGYEGILGCTASAGGRPPAGCALLALAAACAAVRRPVRCFRRRLPSRGAGDLPRATGMRSAE